MTVRVGRGASCGVECAHVRYEASTLSFRNSLTGQQPAVGQDDFLWATVVVVAGVSPLLSLSPPCESGNTFSVGLAPSSLATPGAALASASAQNKLLAQRRQLAIYQRQLTPFRVV